MPNTSIADHTKEGYVFGPDADMSLVAQNHAFTRIVPRADLGDVTENTLIEDADNLDHHGHPLRYYVDHFISDDETVLLDRLNPLPCSVNWCNGHAHHEADTWEGLTHTAGDVPLCDVGLDHPEASYSRREAVTSMIERAGIRRLSLHINVEGEIGPDAAVALSERLREMSDALFDRAMEIKPDPDNEFSRATAEHMATLGGE